MNTRREQFLSDWCGGHKSERLVRQKLEMAFNTKTIDSAKSANIFFDIDCYLDGHAISIKTQHTCSKTGNLAFELEVFDTKMGIWKPSWFFNGRADYYAVLVGRDLYLIHKPNLVEYVQVYGWDKVVTLSNHTKEKQRAGNHRHANAKLGLVKLKKLLDRRVAKKLAGSY